MFSKEQSTRGDKTQDCAVKAETHLFTLTHSHTMTPFDALGKKPFENTVGKGEIARNEQFLLFPLCFLPV